MIDLFVRIDGGVKIQSFVLWITGFIPQYFPRVHLLGRFYFDIISKYILLSLSKSKTKIQISTTVKNGEGGSAGSKVSIRIGMGVFIFYIATTAKTPRSTMLTLRKLLEG